LTIFLVVFLFIEQYTKTRKAKRPIFANALMDSTSVTIVSDASMRNNVVISISHVHSYNNSIKKTIYHAINILSTKTELFAIRCRINQAIQISEVFHIIVITNAIYLVERIFDSIIYSY